MIPQGNLSTYETAPGIINVIAVIEGKRPGRRRLVLSRRLKIFPVRNDEEQKFRPLGGIFSDDVKRLYGRGNLRHEKRYRNIYSCGKCSGPV